MPWVGEPFEVGRGVVLADRVAGLEPRSVWRAPPVDGVHAREPMAPERAEDAPVIGAERAGGLPDRSARAGGTSTATSRSIPISWVALKAGRKVSWKRSVILKISTAS